MPKKDLERDFRLSDLLVAAPAVTGAGLSVHSFIRSLDDNIRAETMMATARPPATRHISETAHYASQAVTGEASVSQFLNKLSGWMKPQFSSDLYGLTRIAPATDPEALMLAWQRATGTLPPELAARIGPDYMDLTEPLSSINNIFRDVLPKLDLAHRNRFIRAFESNVKALRVLPEDVALTGLALADRPFGGQEFITRTITGPEDLPEPIRGYAQRLQEALGVDVRGLFRTRPEWEAAGLGEYQLNLGEGITATIPRSVEGQILSGRELTAKRLAGYFGIWDEATQTMKRMSFSEYLMHRIEQDVAPRMAKGELTASQARGEIQSLQRDLLSRMETVPALPPAIEGEALRGYNRFRSQYLHLVTPTGEAIPLAEAAKTPVLGDLIGKEMFASGPAQMEKGKAFLIDPAQMFLGPEAAPPQRLLGKTFRPVGVMESRLPKRSGPDYSWLFSKRHTEMFGEHPGAIARTIFLKPGGKEAAAVPVSFGEGEFEMSLEWAQRAQRVRDNAISVPKPTKHLRAMFGEEAMALSEEVVLPRGTVLGWAEDQNPITLQYETRIKGGMRRGRGMQLFVEETLAERQPKFFMSKMRGLEVPAETMAAQKAWSHLPYTPDVRADVGVLGKELHMANMQQTSMLWTTLKDLPRKERAALPEDIQRFVAQPAETMEAMVKASTREGAYQHAEYTAKLMEIAKRSDLTDLEYGRVFGAAPVTLGDDWLAQLQSAGAELTSKQQWAVENVSPMGAIFMTAGGPRAERGAGNLASMEPRLFTMLESGAFGKFGKEMATELAARASTQSPEAILASQEIGRSLASFGEGIAGEGMARFAARSQFDPEAFEQFLRVGGMLEVGAGRPDVYVPGMDKVKAMIPFHMDSGKEAYTEIASIYRDLAQGASAVQAGKVSQESFLSSVVGKGGLAEGTYYSAMQRLQREHAPMGKGALGLFRGRTQRVSGSAFLELTSMLSGGGNAVLKGADEFTVGISDYWFEKMMRSLREKNLMTQEAAEEMAERWLAGGDVGGMAWRHPVIGQYSAVPIKFRRVNSFSRDALAAIPDGPLSMLLGLAADKDADIAGFMLLHGQQEENARNFWTQEAIDKYAKHVTAMKVLKPKAPKMASELAQVSVHDLARVATEQISMPEHYLPRLSTTLTEMKYALSVAPHDLRPSAMTILEAMEQFPVSGKHASAREVVKHLDQQGYKPMMEGLMTAVRRGDAEAMGYWFKESIGGQRRIAESQQLRDVLGEGRLKLEQTLAYMAEAWKKYSSTETARDMQLLTGRGRYMKPEELTSYLSRGLGSAQAGVPRVEGMGSAVSKAALTAVNFAGALGKRLIKHAKPLALGSAAAIGLAAVLSRPSEMVGPGSQMAALDKRIAAPPRGRTNAEFRTPENIHPPSNLEADPSAPGRIYAPSARIGSERGYNINARVTTRDMHVDPAALSRELEQSVGNVRDMHVTVQDNRSLMNVQQLLNEIG